MKPRNWNIVYSATTSTLLITPHVPVLLGNESEDTLLHFGNFLWKEMDHNVEFESLLKKWSWWLEGNWECPWNHANTSSTTQLPAFIVVCGDVDGLRRIRLVPVCPKWRRNGVFGKPCPIVLFILQFQILQKVLIQLLPYSFLPDSIL